MTATFAARELYKKLWSDEEIIESALMQNIDRRFRHYNLTEDSTREAQLLAMIESVKETLPPRHPLYRSIMQGVLNGSMEGLLTGSRSYFGYPGVGTVIGSWAGYYITKLSPRLTQEPATERHAAP